MTTPEGAPRRPERIAVLHNDDWKHYPPGSPSYEADAEVAKMAEAIGRALSRAGFEVEILTVDDRVEPLAEELRRRRIDAVFNVVESLGGDARREAEIPALLEALGLPYTGNPAKVLRTANAKDDTRRVLLEAGVPVAGGFVVSDPQDDLAAAIARHRVSFPLFVKPARTDASIGIDQGSIVRDLAALTAQLARVAAAVPGPWLVEEYLPGREVNVAIFPEPKRGQCVCTEIDFSLCAEGVAPIVTYDCKWRPGTPDYMARSLPSRGRLPDAQIEAAQAVARRAFLALGGTSYGRVDLRVGRDGGFYVIDVNPNPDISPDAGLAIAAGSVGVDHDTLILQVMEAALAARERKTMNLRPVQPADRAPLAELLARVENFSPDDRVVALELIDLSITDPVSSGYETIVAELAVDGATKLVGYICFGLTPMTAWTWDLYWVAVDGTVRGQGLGKALTQRFEAEVQARKGRIIRIETSSMESYGGTLDFYLRGGYEIVSRVRDFYKAGDDLITLVKRFDP